MCAYCRASQCLCWCLLFQAPQPKDCQALSIRCLPPQAYPGMLELCSVASVDPIPSLRRRPPFEFAVCRLNPGAKCLRAIAGVHSERVDKTQWVIANVGVHVPLLWINELLLHDANWVWRVEARHGALVEPCPEIVDSHIRVALFPGKLVILRASIHIYLLLFTPREIVGIVALGPPTIGDQTRRSQVVSIVVVDGAQVSHPRDTLPANI